MKIVNQGAYRIVEGGTIAAPSGDIEYPTMTDPHLKPYRVVDSFTVSPLELVQYIVNNFLTEGGTPISLFMPVTNQFNDYSYSETILQLDNAFLFKSIVDKIFSIAYDYCEIRKDESVDGVELSGDSTGFLFKSKYFNSASKFDNYRTLIGLSSERFITLKKQYLMWNYDKLVFNSIDTGVYDFFIFSPPQG